MKKAKATSKAPAKGTAKGMTGKSAKKPARKGRKEIDMAEVRKDIAQIVGAGATQMTQAIVGEGLKGQLAPVKYLFEVSGIYPTAPANEGRPEEDSLARRLLDHLGLPTSPVVSEDGELLATPAPSEDSKEVGEESASTWGEVNSEKNSDEAETSSTDEAPNVAPAGS